MSMDPKLKLFTGTLDSAPGQMEANRNGSFQVRAYVAARSQAEAARAAKTTPGTIRNYWFTHKTGHTTADADACRLAYANPGVPVWRPCDAAHDAPWALGQATYPEDKRGRPPPRNTW